MTTFHNIFPGVKVNIDQTVILIRKKYPGNCKSRLPYLRYLLPGLPEKWGVRLLRIYRPAEESKLNDLHVTKPLPHSRRHCIPSLGTGSKTSL